MVRQTTAEESDFLVSCLMAVCDPATAKNPVAWATLHRIGLTEDVLRRSSDSPDWIGRKPVFACAPKADDPMWLHLTKREPDGGKA